MEYTNAKNNIIDIINQNLHNDLCIQLDGLWGIGKTYLINDIMDELSGFTFIRLSVFGCTDVKELETSLISKLLLKKTITNEPTKQKSVMNIGKLIIDSFGGTNIVSALKTISLDDILPFISGISLRLICFDDIERISDNLNSKELIGFIEKVTQYFKVLLITNSSKFSNDFNSVFNEYKEKVVDITITLDTLEKEVLRKIMETKEMVIDEEIIEVYLSGNMGFGKPQQGKPAYIIDKISNIRVFKKYLDLILRIKVEIGKERKIDRTIYSLCKNVVYKYYYTENVLPEQQEDKYGLKRSIEKLFLFESINKDVFIEYFNDNSEVKSDIISLYNAHKLSENEYAMIISKIKQKIDNKDTTYFINQRNIISIYDSIIAAKYDDFIDEKLAEFAFKIYVPVIGNLPPKYNIEDWDDYTFLGMVNCSEKTAKLINDINSFNSKEYLKYVEIAKGNAVVNKNYKELLQIASIIKINDVKEFDLIFDFYFQSLDKKYNEDDEESIKTLIRRTNDSISESYIKNRIKNEKKITSVKRYELFLNEIDIIQQQEQFYQYEEENRNSELQLTHHSSH